MPVVQRTVEGADIASRQPGQSGSRFCEEQDALEIQMHDGEKPCLDDFGKDVGAVPPVNRHVSSRNPFLDGLVVPAPRQIDKESVFSRKRRATSTGVRPFCSVHTVASISPVVEMFLERVCVLLEVLLGE